MDQSPKCRVPYNRTPKGQLTKRQMPKGQKANDKSIDPTKGRAR